MSVTDPLAGPPAPPTPGICAPWCTPEEVEEICSARSVPDGIETWIEFASLWLFRRTGRRWPGICTITLRPKRPAECGCPGFAYWRPDHGWWGSTLPWWDATGHCGRCSARGQLGNIDEMRLPGPIVGPVTVVVDGVTLPSSAYRVIQPNRLVRIDGGTWPHGNDITRLATDVPAGQPDVPAWLVSYAWGAQPPPDGKIAAAVLARELAAGACGGECRLPDAVVSMTRHGETLEFQPLSELLERQATGITVVDMFIGQYPPRRRRGRAYRAYENPARRIR